MSADTSTMPQFQRSSPRLDTTVNEELRRKKICTDRVLLVHESPSGASKDRCLQMTKVALRRAHIAHDIVTPHCTSWPSLTGYTHVLLCLGYESKLSEEKANAIKSSIESGAGLVMLRPYWNRTLAPLMGLDPQGERPPLLKCEESSRFIEDFLPGLKGIGVKLVGYHMPVSPENVSAFLVSDKNRVMAWCSNYGAGRVVTFNAAICSRYWAPGFIVEALQRTQKISIRPLANVGVVQIDDFPAAVSTLYQDPVASSYSLAMIDFYRQIWLPDMLALAKRCQIPYTFLIPFNYDAAINPPFDFNEWNTVKLDGDSVPFGVRASREIGSDHELGLHGYNHQPFLISHWIDEGHMRSSLRAVLAKWQSDALGPLPRTYVPPGNVYDEATLRAITEECPSVTSICGYLNEHPLLGVEHDYGPEPWCPTLFSMPRNTAGYVRSAAMTLDMLSLISSMGVWCHMLHPDDIVDTPLNFPNSEFTCRNNENRTWRSEPHQVMPGLYDELQQWFDYTKMHYPWLRYMTSCDAASTLKQYQETRILVSRQPGKLSVTGNGTGYFELVMDISEEQNVSVDPEIEILSIRTSWDKRRYVLRTELPSFSIAV
ncbi:MAG: DUF2194 domain-containing protein [Porticoccus sp.]|nr:DUF2194 domain-containing protein [Porticoccus sp.]